MSIALWPFLITLVTGQVQEMHPRHLVICCARLLFVYPCLPPLPSQGCALDQSCMLVAANSDPGNIPLV